MMSQVSVSYPNSCPPQPMQDPIHIKYRMIDKYVLLETLGYGAFGKVYHARNMVTEVDVAIKRINKQKLDQQTVRNLEKEISLQQMVSQHPCVVNVLDAFENDTHLFVVMEYLCRGDLLNYIGYDRTHPDDPRFNVPVLFKDLIDGLQQCHCTGVFHGDIKPENLVLSQDFHLKICDFGFAQLYKKDGRQVKLRAQRGTLHYVAPEVFDGPYDPEPVDVWAAGVTLFGLLTTQLPCDQATCHDSKFAKMASGDLSYCPWDELPDIARDLLVRMLTINPRKRITLEGVRQHPFYTGSLSPTTSPFPSPFADCIAVEHQFYSDDLPLVRRSTSPLSTDAEIFFPPLVQVSSYWPSLVERMAKRAGLHITSHRTGVVTGQGAFHVTAEDGVGFSMKYRIRTRPDSIATLRLFRGGRPQPGDSGFAYAKLVTCIRDEMK